MSAAAPSQSEDVRHHNPHKLPELDDPGKEDRARRGLPVVPAFDGFRAYAILLIAFFHTLGAAGVTTAAGGRWGGQLIWGTFPHLVDILFILSGFVVFLPTVARRGEFGSVANYAVRRAARLLPAYWLVLVICALTLALLPAYHGSLPAFSEMAVDFSGTHQIFALFDTRYLPGFGVDLPMWTLSLEIGFYIALPFCAAVYFRHPLAGLAVAALIAIVWRGVFDNLDWFNDTFNLGMSAQSILEANINSGGQLPSWAFSFGAGMSAAWAYVRLHERNSVAHLARIATPAAFAALATLAIFAYLAGRYAITVADPVIAVVARQNIFIAVGYTASLATLMLSIALGPRWLQAPFAHPFVRKLGDISYGVYLIHSVIIFIVLVQIDPIRDGSLGAVAIWAACVFPASLLFGYLSARFVEQPIRRWARQFGRRAEQRPAPPGGAAGSAPASESG